MLCALLALTACGGGRDARDDKPGLLKRAFAGSSGGSGLDLPKGGGLCGDPYLVGEAIGKVDGNGACGIDNAVRLRAVGHVGLSTPATINCKTAGALKEWLNDQAEPIMATRGGIDSLKVAASYSCRTRNHKKGAKLSEHSYGNAIDIAAIRAKDGSEITLEEGWNKRKDGALLRLLHTSACGIFGTVLGPEADALHHDHFHFDVASYRMGSYCK